jgi:hypothetical protein
VLQVFQQRRRRHGLHAGGRQLDRQGQAIQAPADLRYRRGTVVGGTEGWLDRPYPLQKERYRSVRPQLVGRQRLLALHQG